jgi:hypothetical protein
MGLIENLSLRARRDSIKCEAALTIIRLFGEVRERERERERERDVGGERRESFYYYYNKGKEHYNGTLCIGFHCSI